MLLSSESHPSSRCKERRESFDTSLHSGVIKVLAKKKSATREQTRRTSSIPLRNKNWTDACCNHLNDHQCTAASNHYPLTVIVVRMAFFSADDLCEVDKPVPLERILLDHGLHFWDLPVFGSKQSEVPVVWFQTFAFGLDMSPDRGPPEFDWKGVSLNAKGRAEQLTMPNEGPALGVEEQQHQREVFHCDIQRSDRLRTDRQKCRTYQVSE